MRENTYDAMPIFVRTDISHWKSLILAAAVHLLLLAFLWIGVQWQNKESTAVEAEVWDMTTRQAAPLPSPPVIQEAQLPVPLPKIEPTEDPEIAIAQEKKRKQKQQELEAAKKKEQLAKEVQDKQKLAKEKQAQEKIFEENMRRLNGQAVKSTSGGSGDAAKSTGNNRGDPSYAARIAAKVRPNTIYVVNDTSSNNPTVEFQMNLFPDGTLRGPLKKLKSSGVPAFDDAVEKAIDKSLPFPRDKSGEVPPSIVYVHRMKE